MLIQEERPKNSLIILTKVAFSLISDIHWHYCTICSYDLLTKRMGNGCMPVSVCAKCFQVYMFILYVALKTSLTKTWYKNQVPKLYYRWRHTADGAAAQFGSGYFSLDGVKRTPNKQILGYFYFCSTLSCSVRANEGGKKARSCVFCVFWCFLCVNILPSVVILYLKDLLTDPAKLSFNG